jgi:hypothetical protein
MTQPHCGMSGTSAQSANRFLYSSKNLITQQQIKRRRFDALHPQQNGNLRVCRTSWIMMCHSTAKLCVYISVRSEFSIQVRIQTVTGQDCA